MKKAGLKVFGITMLTGLLAVIFVPSASADTGPARHGDDVAYTQYLNDDIITVCDHEADGNGVYAEYYLDNGSANQVGDGNGSASGCGQKNWTATPYWVDRFRVCETGVGCSSWWYTDGLGGNRVTSKAEAR